MHTASDPESDTYPSTPQQTAFARQLADELISIGLNDVELDQNGYVTATLPATPGITSPVAGFIAHMDTSPDFPGQNVNPVVHTCYDGSPLHLKNKVTIHPDEFPFLKNYTGQDLITSDGTTLLGADDKAGVAEIVTAMEYLLAHPEIPHGKIRLGFTPDEETGRGTERFDTEKFGADFAYTVDGGEIGELEYENFNAALATVRISGRSVHPGSAKNIMVNAALVGHAFISMLPPDERPEHTENYEGFFHLIHFNGTVENADLQFLIRDHDSSRFEHRKKTLVEIAGLLNLRFGEGTVRTEIRDQYYNMKEKIVPVFYIVDLAAQAMRKVGIEPRTVPVRGGTDGARLSFKGLPCPNIFTGGHNFHGPYEFIPIPSMAKAVRVIVAICELASKLKS